MKKKKYYVLAILFLVLGSSYRFIQLNKDVWGEELYTEVSPKSCFNINGVDFQLEKIEVLNNKENSDLKFSIKLNKHGKIKSENSFITNYPTSIILNITDKRGVLINNYVTDYEKYFKDNPKLAKIQSGERNLGDEEESLKLTFQVEKDIIKNVDNNVYNIKLVFPEDNHDFKFNFINIDLDNLYI